MKCAFFGAMCIVAWLTAAGSLQAEDWTYWRGPYMDGTSMETGLPDSWESGGR